MENKYTATFVLKFPKFGAEINTTTMGVEKSGKQIFNQMSFKQEHQLITSVIELLEEHLEMLEADMVKYPQCKSSYQAYLKAMAEESEE